MYAVAATIAHFCPGLGDPLNMPIDRMMAMAESVGKLAPKWVRMMPL